LQPSSQLAGHLHAGLRVDIVEPYRAAIVSWAYSLFHTHGLMQVILQDWRIPGDKFIELKQVRTIDHAISDGEIGTPVELVDSLKSWALKNKNTEVLS
jgi:hypothetical protein